MTIDYPTQAQIPALKNLWTLAFGDGEEFLTPFFETAWASDRCRCVEAEGQTVAALYWFESFCGNQRLAYVYAVATHPDWRGRGLCAALMEDTAEVLKSQGYDGILLCPASEGLFRMYGKMGYHPCTTIREWECTAAGTPVPMTKISKAEYARLRRRLMPHGGVIQEGPLLDLLAEFAVFYAGDGWTAAISTEEGQLRCHELLGDFTVAPHILCALGVQKGTFRAPGSEKPFTMALGFTVNYTDPGYFGLPMD